MGFTSAALHVLTAGAALGAAVAGFINSRKIEKVHVSTNSRMDQLLRLRGEASKAEGVAQERREQKASGNGNDWIINKLKE